VAEVDIRALVQVATAARDRAYVPYSHFAVGAALLSEDGRVYTGCNVENASYGLTICAERNAVFHAIAEGSRRFLAVAVVTANGVAPCGACRQVLTEFNPEMTVAIASTSGELQVLCLADLLPRAFSPTDLRQT